MRRLYVRCSLVLYVIETCLLAFCEGHQYKTMPYFIKISQTPKYNRDIYQEMYKLRSVRKSDTFDYNYGDWEDTKPDYYNIFMKTSDAMNTQTQTTQTASTKTTKPNTVSITSPTEDNKPTVTVHDTTMTNAETHLETESIVGTSLTTLPEYPDLNEDMFQPTTESVTTERNPVVDEIVEVQRATRGGYFTSGFLVTMKKLAAKKPEHLQPLLVGLNAAVTRLNNNRKLMMFGPMVQETIISTVHLASITPMDSIQLQALNGVNLFENRTEALLPETNAILDVADTIFIDDDLRNLANFLTDVENYPNTTKAAIDIASDAITAFIITPYERIKGTAEEELLLLEINNAVRPKVYED